MEYLIRFQDTGTDTAFHVVIRDTLSHLLDPGSVRLGASSHPCTAQLMGQGTLVFDFPQIMLPNSNTNEAASQGFVSFTVAQRPDNPDAAEILNRAGIFFDFNLPVLTNETRHTVGIPVPVPSVEAAQQSVFIAPNPFGQGFELRLSTAPERRHHFQLCHLAGGLADMGFFEGNTLNYRGENLEPGLYLLLVRPEGGHWTGVGKVVKIR